MAATGRAVTGDAIALDMNAIAPMLIATGSSPSTASTECLPFRLASGDLLYATSSAVRWEAPLLVPRRRRGVLQHKRSTKRVAVTVPQADLIGAKLVAPDDPASALVEIAELYEVVTRRRRAVVDHIVRQLRTHVVPLVSRGDATRLVDVLRILALGSTTRVRRMKVLLNPHSGKKIAVHLFEARIAPLLAYAGFEADVVVSDHAGHAIEVGKELNPARYEGVLVVGGDGTVQELLSGLLSRPDWRTLIRRVPICSVACGTQNALARGIRTPLPEYASWCVIKHRLRPLDAMLVSNAAGLRTISLCGVGFGLAADIATDSEAYRYLGIARYAYLKVRHSLSLMLGITRHGAHIVMDADVAIDDIGLALYFAKPFTTVRVPTSRGLVIARRPIEDPEGEKDEAVLARLLAEGSAAPPDVRLLRTASMGAGMQPHFHGGSTLMPVGGPGDRVARVQLSTTALEPFLGSQAGDVVTRTAQQVKHRVLKAGGGEVLGVDSATVGAMAASGVDIAVLASQPLQPSDSEPPPGSGAHPRGTHYAQQSLLSAPAERRAGGGIVTLDAPTAVLVAQMKAHKKALAAGLSPEEEEAERVSHESTAPQSQAEASAAGPAPSQPLSDVLLEARDVGASTIPRMERRAANLAATTVDIARARERLPRGPAAGASLAEPAGKPPYPVPTTVPSLSNTGSGSYASSPAVTIDSIMTQYEPRSRSPRASSLLAMGPAGRQPIYTMMEPAALVPVGSNAGSVAPVSIALTGDEDDDAAAGSFIPRAISPRFGKLVRCERNCAVCRKNGRLRYIGHRREAIIVAPELTSSRGHLGLASAADAMHGTSSAFGGASDSSVVTSIVAGLPMTAAASGAGSSGGPGDYYVAYAGGVGGTAGSGSLGTGGFPVLRRAAPAPERALAGLGDGRSPLRGISRHCPTQSTIPGRQETVGEPRLTTPLMSNAAAIGAAGPLFEPLPVPVAAEGSGGAPLYPDAPSPSDVGGLPSAGTGEHEAAPAAGGDAAHGRGLDGGTGGTLDSAVPAVVAGTNGGGGAAAPGGQASTGAPVTQSALARTAMTISAGDGAVDVEPPDGPAAAPGLDRVPATGARPSFGDAILGGGALAEDILPPPSSPTGGGSRTYSSAPGAWATDIPRDAARSRSRGIFSRSFSRDAARGASPRGTTGISPFPSSPGTLDPEVVISCSQLTTGDRPRSTPRSKLGGQVLVAQALPEWRSGADVNITGTAMEALARMLPPTPDQDVTVATAGAQQAGGGMPSEASSSDAPPLPGPVYAPTAAPAEVEHTGVQKMPLMADSTADNVSTSPPAAGLASTPPPRPVGSAVTTTSRGPWYKRLSQRMRRARTPPQQSSAGELQSAAGGPQPLREPLLGPAAKPSGSGTGAQSAGAGSLAAAMTVFAAAGEPVGPSIGSESVVAADTLEAAAFGGAAGGSSAVFSTALPAGVHPHTRRNFERRAEHSSYITVGMMNVVPEAKYQHPSDSYVDLVFARKGGPIATIALMLRYLVGKELGSPLYGYVKVRSVALTPDEPDAALNVDGEVLPGPGPFRVNLLPSLLTVYGEF